MSGTSADGIDACLAQWDGQTFQSRAHYFYPYPATLKAKVEGLFNPADNEIDRLGELNIELADYYSHAVSQLLEKSGVPAEQVRAIGNHGQTVRHRPNVKRAFTLQLGCATRLALSTGIPVISDFRTADMALGGQGAPLVPAFHQATFASSEHNRAILNIGGIANITVLNKNGDVTGWDTGPGNGLMDSWIKRHKQCDFDDKGAWAASGEVDNDALATLLNHPYFLRKPPKSTGKEEFTLDGILTQLPSIPPENLQATLLMLTCRSVAMAIKEANIDALYVCGGGAHNDHLLAKLQQELEIPVSTTKALGIDPMHIEALAFAWLAYRHEHNLPGNIPSVTGAARTCVLGTKYLPR